MLPLPQFVRAAQGDQIAGFAVKLLRRVAGGGVNASFHQYSFRQAIHRAGCVILMRTIGGNVHDERCLSPYFHSFQSRAGLDIVEVAGLIEEAVLEEPVGRDLGVRDSFDLPDWLDMGDEAGRADTFSPGEPRQPLFPSCDGEIDAALAGVVMLGVGHPAGLVDQRGECDRAEITALRPPDVRRDEGGRFCRDPQAVGKLGRDQAEQLNIRGLAHKGMIPQRSSSRPSAGRSVGHWQHAHRCGRLLRCRVPMSA